LASAHLVCISCDGFIFQHYKTLGFNYKIENFLLKFAGVKVCVFPYGGDAYVYSRIQDKNWFFGLMSDYPEASKNQSKIGERVDYFIAKADLFLPGAMLFDGMGRTDWFTPSTLCIDVPKRNNRSRNHHNQIVVTHAPNHRAVKGTRFIIETVEKLVQEGVGIELKLLENETNQEVMRVLAEESDIHIDQLHFDGYGLNAIESMSLGVPTIGNFSGISRDFFDRWSFTTECPMIVASEKTLGEVLLNLVENRNQLQDISKKSVMYIEKHHSSEAFAMNFSQILQKTDPRYIKHLEAKGQ
jgi:hypothetical protein